MIYQNFCRTSFLSQVDAHPEIQLLSFVSSFVFHLLLFVALFDDTFKTHSCLSLTLTNIHSFSLLSPHILPISLLRSRVSLSLSLLPSPICSLFLSCTPHTHTISNPHIVSLSNPHIVSLSYPHIVSLSCPLTHSLSLIPLHCFSLSHTHFQHSF